MNLKPGRTTNKKPIPKLIPSQEPADDTDTWSLKNKDQPVGDYSRNKKHRKYMDYRNQACKAELDETVSDQIAALYSGVLNETKSNMVGYLFPEAKIRRI